MLACDIIGFHVQNHCNNFLETANRLLECRIDTERSSVIRLGKETFIKPFPISIDTYFNGDAGDDTAGDVDKIREEYQLKDKMIAVGVERIDYTKGILEMILAIDRFLEKYPQYKDKFIFIQLAAPSRTHINRYHDLTWEIDELVEKDLQIYRVMETDPLSEAVFLLMRSSVLYWLICTLSVLCTTG